MRALPHFYATFELRAFYSNDFTGRSPIADNIRLRLPPESGVPYFLSILDPDSEINDDRPAASDYSPQSSNRADIDIFFPFFFRPPQERSSATQ